MHGRLMIFSSDGHAVPRMEDWRPYLPSAIHDEFDAFCAVYREQGSKSFEPAALLSRLDPETVEEWSRQMLEPGRLEGSYDPARRQVEIDREGIAGEVLFPDFGFPFELRAPSHAGSSGQVFEPTAEQEAIGSRAFNRWLADFCKEAPHRWAGMASVLFDDVDAAVAEIKWAHAAGLKGIVLPHFDEDLPIFHPNNEPVWTTLEELGMVVNCHASISSISKRKPRTASVTHPGIAPTLMVQFLLFGAQQLLYQVIWGGVLERHPRLQFVITESGSGWIPAALASMDHAFEGSYLRRDNREVIQMRPSDYFARQCHIGSSIFSKAEMDARYQIGLEKMMLGMDYPHHEGTLAGPGTKAYVQATVGAAGVPADEARLLLGQTAAKVFGMDVGALTAISERIGPTVDEILNAPDIDRYPRGDVHKPIVPSI